MSSEGSKKRSRDDDYDLEVDEPGKRCAPSKPDAADDSSTLTAPFFHYIDHSTEQDSDPFTPLAPMARVPTFPAKMFGEFAWGTTFSSASFSLASFRSTCDAH